MMPETTEITSPQNPSNKGRASSSQSTAATDTPMYLTSTIGLFRGLIDYCRQTNIPVEPILLEAQLKESELNNIDGRIPSERYHNALLKAEELSSDPDFAVHFGEAIKPGHYGVVGLVAMSCEKVGELLQLHVRYQSLVGDDTDVEYLVEEKAIELRTHPKLECMQNNLSRQVGAFASWITLARWITGLDQHYPLRVNFTTPAPENTAELTRVFGSELHWEQPFAGVIFDTSLLDLNLPQANPTLRKQLEHQAEERLIAAGGAQYDPLLKQLQSYIAKHLADGAPDIETIAGQLALSTRALQRRLSELKTSFSQILDNTRKELAMSYISQKHISLTEIAFLLGFSEQSAFNRAFKRWTQQSPSAYRKNL